MTTCRLVGWFAVLAESVLLLPKRPNQPIWPEVESAAGKLSENPFLCKFSFPRSSVILVGGGGGCDGPENTFDRVFVVVD